MTRLQEVSAVVIVFWVIDRPDNGEFVGPLSDPRQVLADPHFGCFSRDVFEGPTNVAGGIGFHVERFQLAWSAIQENEDDTLGTSGEFPRTVASNLFRSQDVLQAHAQHPCTACLNELASGDAVTGLLSITEDFDHGC